MLIKNLMMKRYGLFLAFLATLVSLSAAPSYVWGSETGESSSEDTSNQTSFSQNSQKIRELVEVGIAATAAGAFAVSQHRKAVEAKAVGERHYPLPAQSEKRAGELKSIEGILRPGDDLRFNTVPTPNEQIKEAWLAAQGAKIRLVKQQIEQLEGMLKDGKNLSDLVLDSEHVIKKRIAALQMISTRLQTTFDGVASGQHLVPGLRRIQLDLQLPNNKPPIDSFRRALKDLEADGLQPTHLHVQSPHEEEVRWRAVSKRNFGVAGMAGALATPLIIDAINYIHEFNDSELAKNEQNKQTTTLAKDREGVDRDIKRNPPPSFLNSQESTR